VANYDSVAALGEGESGRSSSSIVSLWIEPSMLVLSRKVGETILIGDNIAVTVVQVGPGNVRLGVVAPPEVVIVREELREQFKSGSRCEQQARQS
jgi:carbon storage regulator